MLKLKIQKRRLFREDRLSLKFIAGVFGFCTLIFIIGLAAGMQSMVCFCPEAKIPGGKFTFFEKPDSSLTIENVYKEILKNEIHFDQHVMSQCINETRWLTSYNCLVRNNLFGMKGGKREPGNNEGYKIYSSWQESVAGYKQYQEKRLDYWILIEKWGYAEDSLYTTHCEQIRTKLFE